MSILILTYIWFHLFFFLILKKSLKFFAFMLQNFYAFMYAVVNHFFLKEHRMKSLLSWNGINKTYMHFCVVFIHFQCKCLCWPICLFWKRTWLYSQKVVIFTELPRYVHQQKYHSFFFATCIDVQTWIIKF